MGPEERLRLIGPDVYGFLQELEVFSGVKCKSNLIVLD
jgi:hypothetical protein